MRWLVDAQLPPALAHFLKRQGDEASHVSELMMINATDTDIWNYAINTDSVIITKDEDFQNRAALSSQCPFIVWLRFGNCSTRHCIAKFESVLAEVVLRVESGETIIEVR
ncbi:MAG: DUF5615 family PIN-like protein [Verrucomicrobiales bacterium]|nr:DUF5615 family PIN-like protein [Verrucomicrobiales bacterium]